MNDRQPQRTPAKVWSEMVRGNQRFVAGEPLHPRQDAERRAELANAQHPSVALFGCADSRLAAEIIFDKGLGDLFVVRNAGQVIGESIIGSLEYAVAVLGVPLIVVLAHDSCGAVSAAIQSRAADTPRLPTHVHSIVGTILPAVIGVAGDDVLDPNEVDPAEVGLRHLRNTVTQLVARSELISDAVAAGTLAVIGANYRLADGRVEAPFVVGSIDLE